MNYYYDPLNEVINFISNYCITNNFTKILEIGGGNYPLSFSTHLIDYKIYDETLRNKTTLLDVSKQKLPFNDNYFDFVYCRHVLEDLYNPFILLDEINRVSNSGYIETPSPIIELTRSIDTYGKYYPYRGYIHHRYIFSNYNGLLNIITKYPVIEYYNFSIDDNKNYLNNKFNWNMYYLWNKKKGLSLNYIYKQLDIDYSILDNKLNTSYCSLLVDFINNDMSGKNQFVNLL